MAPVPSPESLLLRLRNQRQRITPPMMPEITIPALAAIPAMAAVPSPWGAEVVV